MSTFNNPYHPEISERSVVGISKIQTFYPKNSKFIPKENEKENAECIDIAISDVFFFSHRLHYGSIDLDIAPHDP